MMLTELCQYLRNWFNEGQKKHIGKITVTGEEITCARDGLLYPGVTTVPLVPGQYFCVFGSLFSDGVHQFPDFEMPEETFDGAIWPMAVPPAIVKLAEEIEEWRKKYETVDSLAMSPFTSESFAGYSYSKGGAGATGGEGLSGWQSVFASRLDPWRKI